MTKITVKKARCRNCNGVLLEIMGGGWYHERTDARVCLNKDDEPVVDEAGNELWATAKESKKKA